ncbi:hypothetical protein N7T98_26465, partial [Pseudomonas syringae pv. tomato]|uniref:hypothetical protein n=1 Tax=Pseudomonas syringae group genomosp. 3 TaxID=251701 RepID=UPI0022A6BF01
AYNSYAGHAGDNFAMYDSIASGVGCCAALYDSTADYCSTLAMYNSKGISGGNSIAIFDSITQGNEAFTMYNSDIGSDHLCPGMALYNSKISKYIDGTFSLLMFN